MLPNLSHRLMIVYHGWRVHRAVVALKRAGRRHGLPSLNGYSDAAIAEGLRRLREGEDA